MAERIKAPAADYPIPKDRDELCRFVERIGVAQRRRAKIEAAMNDAIAKVRARYEGPAREEAEIIEAFAKGVRAYAEAHRAELVEGGSKTVRLSTGEIAWRMTPPSVRIRGREAVIAALKKAGLARFVRVREDVDRAAMLKEPEAVAAIDGVSIERREEFVIRPDGTRLEEIRR